MPVLDLGARRIFSRRAGFGSETPDQITRESEGSTRLSLLRSRRKGVARGLPRRSLGAGPPKRRSGRG